MNNTNTGGGSTMANNLTSLIFTNNNGIYESFNTVLPISLQGNNNTNTNSTYHSDVATNNLLISTISNNNNNNNNCDEYDDEMGYIKQHQQQMPVSPTRSSLRLSSTSSSLSKDTNNVNQQFSLSTLTRHSQ
eukprot:UN10112